MGYLEYRDIQQSYFQVQFLNPEINRNICLTILSHYQRICRRLNHQHQHYQRICRRLNHQDRSEIINEKRGSKHEEQWISENCEIFKMKKITFDKESYAKIIGIPEHEKIKARKREQHKIYLDKIRGPAKHNIRILKNRNMKNISNRNDGFMERVNAAKAHIQGGPFYNYIACNRYLYRRSVCRFRFDSYKNSNENILFCVDSHDGEYYICLKCDRKLKKNVTSCHAVVNKLAVERLPAQFQTIRRLESVLVSRRIFFKKVTIMLKGQSPKLKGSICKSISAKF